MTGMGKDLTTALPPHDFAGRRDRLRARLAELGVDGLYVTGAANVAYLTGFTGSNGQVVVGTATDADALCTDARYEGRAAVESPDIAAVITRAPFDEALGRVDGRVGFEADHVTYHEGTELLARGGEAGRDAIAVRGAVEGLRILKDDSEVARLRRACAITTEAFDAMLAGLHAGRTERDLAVELERRFVDLGADGLAFDLIVASGPNGAIPHHEPTDRAVEDGELVTFDIGAMVDGYHADFTRTVAVGQPHPAWADLHELVVNAQQAGVDAVRAGTTCKEVDAAARDLIDGAGHGGAFVHGIGHGVGLEIHEAPIVSTRPTARLDASTVITVEPGVYLPASADRPADAPPGGIRIEDTVLVTADGPADHLTIAPHDLLILP
jgi:Xaa-Pro aminopeptidase